MLTIKGKVSGSLSVAPILGLQVQKMTESNVDSSVDA